MPIVALMFTHPVQFWLGLGRGITRAFTLVVGLVSLHQWPTPFAETLKVSHRITCELLNITPLLFALNAF